MEDQYGITLVCFNCGKKVDVVINRPIQFAFELASIADEAGMLGVIDMNYGRSLVFCDEKCRKESLTKKGTYRVRPKVKTEY